MNKENLHILSNHEFTGRWWIPGKRKLQNYGKLICTQDNIELQIQGPLWPKKNDYIIFGLTTNNELITLFGCLTPTQNLFNNWTLKRISVGRLAVGYLFRNEKSEITKSLNVTYENLNYWIGVPNFLVSDSLANFRKENLLTTIIKKMISPKQVKDFFPDSFIKYSRPWKTYKTIFSDEKISIKVGYITRMPEYDPFDTEAKITERPFLKIESTQKWTFEDYSKIIWKFQNFLTIMLNKPTKVLFLKSFINKKNEYGDYIEINHYYRLSSPNQKNSISWLDSKYNFKYLGDKRAQDMISKWFSNYEKIEDILDLFFYNENQSFTYLQHKFLNLIQALESFHRHTRINSKTNSEDHKNKIDEILNSVPLKYKDWLRNKLTYSNESTLRDRINDLYTEFSFLLDKILENSKKRKNILNKLSATRNYLTHFDSKGKNQSAKLLELQPLSEFLTFWLKLCLLKNIGFENHEIESIVNENRKLNSYLTLKFNN